MTNINLECVLYAANRQLLSDALNNRLTDGLKVLKAAALADRVNALSTADYACKITLYTINQLINSPRRRPYEWQDRNAAAAVNRRSAAAADNAELLYDMAEAYCENTAAILDIRNDNSAAALGASDSADAIAAAVAAARDFYGASSILDRRSKIKLLADEIAAEHCASSAASKTDGALWEMLVSAAADVRREQKQIHLQYSGYNRTTFDSRDGAEAVMAVWSALCNEDISALTVSALMDIATEELRRVIPQFHAVDSVRDEDGEVKELLSLFGSVSTVTAKTIHSVIYRQAVDAMNAAAGKALPRRFTVNRQSLPQCYIGAILDARRSLKYICREAVKIYNQCSALEQAALLSKLNNQSLVDWRSNYPSAQRSAAADAAAKKLRRALEYTRVNAADIGRVAVAAALKQYR